MCFCFYLEDLTNGDIDDSTNVLCGQGITNGAMCQNLKRNRHINLFTEYVQLNLCFAELLRILTKLIF